MVPPPPRFRAWAFAAFTLFATAAHATPPSADIQVDCSANEPGDVVCSGQHPGDAVTGAQALSDGATTTTGTISKATGGRLTPSGNASRGGGTFARATGLSAGDALPPGWSVWAATSYTRTENDLATTKSHGLLKTALVGLDNAVTDRLIVGLAIGIERNDVHTFFNAGSQELTGFTFAPYFAYAFNEIVSVDGTIGYTHVDIEQNRLDSTDFVSRIDGDNDSERLFAAGNVHFWIPYERWALAMRAGLVAAIDQHGTLDESGGPDAFSTPARNLDFVQAQIGGEAIWFMGAWEPYASAFLEHEITHEEVKLNPAQLQPANDRANLRLGGGIRYYGDGGLSGALEWTALVGKADFDGHSVLLTGRYTF